MNSNVTDQKLASRIDDLKEGKAGVATLLGSFVRRQNSKSEQRSEIEKSIELTKKLKDIALTILNDTRGNVISLFEETITKCIQSVYTEENFEFKLAEKKVAGKIGYSPSVIEDDEYYDPEDEKGRGVCNLIGFVARIISVYLYGLRRTIILDEPFTNLGEYIYRIRPILQEMSEQFNTQFIIITNDERLMDSKFKTFRVDKKGKESKIKEVGNG